MKGKCPTCRRKLRRGDDNSVAASLFDKIPHTSKHNSCQERDILVNTMPASTSKSGTFLGRLLLWSRVLAQEKSPAIQMKFPPLLKRKYAKTALRT